MFPKKWRRRKMNVSLEYSKTLAGEGAILLLLSLVPYAGWILGIIGVILLLRGMKELSNYYQDDEIYKNTLTGVKFYIIAIVAAGVAIAAITVGVWSATGFTFTTGSFVPTVAFGVGVAAFLAGLVLAFVFYVLATLHLRRTFSSLAQKSGEASFTTAGSLLWWGAILSIILVGFVLIFIAWIFAAIGFFAMRPQPQQSYPQYASSPPSTQPEQGNVGMNQNNTLGRRGIQ
jgi:uncharacterized membrane protein